MPPTPPNQPPLVELEENGTPTVLSYNVPEPTSYSGRNYIDIQLPAEAFTTVIAARPVGQPPPTPLAAAPSLPMGSLSHPALRLAVAEAPVWPGPTEVSTADSGTVADAGDETPVIRDALEPVTDRLAQLTHGAVRAMTSAGQRPVVFRGSGGLLDVRGVKIDDAVERDAGAFATSRFSPLLAAMLPDGGREPPEPPDPPALFVFLDTPTRGSTVRGPGAGLNLTVSGRWWLDGGAGLPKIVVSLDGNPAGDASVLSDGTWSLPAVVISISGGHSVAVEATARVRYGQRTITIGGSDSVNFTVALDDADPDPPPTLPSVVVSAPSDRTVVAAPTGIGSVAISGTAASNVAGRLVNVEAVNTRTGTRATVDVGAASGAWSVELQLEGAGGHLIEVTAISDGRRSAPVTRLLTVAAEQPVRRLLNRLLLVETLSLSSFRGAFGAGPMIRTFSLLPGERTTLSIKTFTRSAETMKNAACILDSTASEASSAFDDAISREQIDKRAESEAHEYKVGAEASAMWGWGTARVSAEFSGAANSAREESVKNVMTATRKHAMKASSNRSVTINTDYEVQREDKVEESTTREIANINVSRTLNFTFRGLNQEFVALVHLTNVRVGYYTEDLLLGADLTPLRDPNGAVQIRPTYREVSLPELQSLLDAAVVADWHGAVRALIIKILTGIPDHQDVLRTVVEEATPKNAKGEKVPGATYLRFPRNLATTWQDPGSSLTFTVPGIVLASDKIVLRTDGVIVDCVLGRGDGLDAYSHGLQDQAIAERQLANAAAEADVARRRLAVEIVKNGDAKLAALYAKVFPPPRPARPAGTDDGKPSPSDKQQEA